MVLRETRPASKPALKCGFVGTGRTAPWHDHSIRLQAKLAVRAEAHEFQTGGIRLSVDENQVGFEMAIAKIVPGA